MASIDNETGRGFMAFRWRHGLLAIAGLAASLSHAQPYPNRPLRIIVPYPPGASVDFTARLMGGRMSEAFGQPVVIDNRGGAGGVIAADLAARAVPDGYTLFFGTPAALCISPAVRLKVPYDTQRDFAPITRVVVNSQILVVLPSFPANSVAELVKVAKAKPGQLSYASVGIGSPQHLGLELLKHRAGIDVVHVPYKGGGLAMPDVLAGRVQVYMGSIPGILPLVKQGKLKVLGVAGLERVNVLPNVPTIAETVPGYEFVGTWYGMLTQAKVDRAIITRLNQVLTAALQSEDVRQTLISQGSEPRPMSVEDFTKFVRTDCPNWARAVKLAGIKPE
ncbi:MAG: tripartite tricarboxylate transporter substrate binding protein [Betaproteobacteria bacterium]|nr:MAG: tripartite tricarboxylate transporter substrate binding protein [Betaproteobacteria bacterium]